MAAAGPDADAAEALGGGVDTAAVARSVVVAALVARPGLALCTPQGLAVQISDDAVRFRTIGPVPYTGRTPHIHVKRGGDAGNARDFLWRHLSPSAPNAITVPSERGAARSVAGSLYGRRDEVRQLRGAAGVNGLSSALATLGPIPLELGTWRCSRAVPQEAADRASSRTPCCSPHPPPSATPLR